MNREAHFTHASPQADCPSQSARDTSVPATIASSPTLVRDLDHPRRSTDSTPLMRPQAAGAVATDFDPRKIRLFFAHAGVAGIVSRTRGFAQHAV